MYLLDVYAVACAAEYETCSHGFCESAGLGRSQCIVRDTENGTSPDSRSLLDLPEGN